MRPRPVSAPISSKILGSTCSAGSRAIISPFSACRCCRCLLFCAAKGCSPYDIGCSDMLVFGLTGSIGMGKSTTARLFSEAGVPVYDADATVHKIYEGEAAPAIEAAFPGTTVDGKVAREKLSAKVIHNPTAMKQLEQIVHPMLRAYHQAFLGEAERAGAQVAVCDVRLLFETGGEKRVDAVVVVSTSPEAQRERILARDNMTNEKLDAILARQLPDAEKRKRADFIVDTSHGLEPVRAAIRDILAEVVKMPQRRT